MPITNKPLPPLPPLPGQYRWQVTASGARIFKDLRARRHGGHRQQVGHFTVAVLRHVLLGEPLDGEPWQRRARTLQRLLTDLGVT